MDSTRLDRYSRALAEVILRRFPEWRSLAKVETEGSGAGAGYLLIEVPPPLEAEADYPLTITTSNEEVTVGFDHYHSHFDEWASDDPEAPAALNFIESLLAESEAVVSFWRGEKWCGSTTMSEGERLQPIKSAPSAQRVRIRSWRGTLNADYAV